MTFALARKLGSRIIRANSILPECTNILGTKGNFDGALGEKLIEGTPLGRFREPTDISPIAVFLASDDAHWVTGESIRASEGKRCRVLIIKTEIFHIISALIISKNYSSALKQCQYSLKHLSVTLLH